MVFYVVTSGIQLVWTIVATAPSEVEVIKSVTVIAVADEGMSSTRLAFATIYNWP